MKNFFYVCVNIFNAKLLGIKESNVPDLTCAMWLV